MIMTTPYSSPNQTTHIPYYQQDNNTTNNNNNVPIINDHDSLSSATFNMNVQQHYQSLIQKIALMEDDTHAILTHTQSLINACNDPLYSTQIDSLKKRLDNISPSLSSSSSSPPLDQAELQNFVNEIKDIGDTCIGLSREAPHLCCEVDTNSGFSKELPKVLNSVNYSNEHKLLDQLDLDICTWFRHYFVGKPYHTFIGPLRHPSSSSLLPSLDTPTPKRRNSKSFIHSFLNNSPQQSLDTQDHIGIISVIEERATDSNTNQYRIIIRSKQVQNIYSLWQCH